MRLPSVPNVADSKFGTVPSYYPHSNPPLKSIKTDIEEHLDHTLKRAYEGQTFFWGVKPKNGNFIEFWFEKPIIIESYLFRSGNAEHVSDKFYDTVVEVLRQSRSSNPNFTVVGSFDEFGIADGELKLGPIVAIRLRVNSNSFNWAILSEIELKEKTQVVNS
ncbi:unnamed protein product [Arctia plantaginis]|uniref:MGAT4 A/B/C C-terminal domain-containing protein n=1 Tax=Arctia plantaginis TaxID=874455 RepID=A0A8S0Z265_ARCPL|nr:unnamed protein product [Arctia plantaginis]